MDEPELWVLLVLLRRENLDKFNFCVMELQRLDGPFGVMENIQELEGDSVVQCGMLSKVKLWGSY